MPLVSVQLASNQLDSNGLSNGLSTGGSDLIGKESPEFNASEVRVVLQELFPSRKLVLSQFTFFNHAGVSKPTGEKFRRGRRCYQVKDLLPIAVILALKEQGIPNKNIQSVPTLVQENCDKIFNLGYGTRISGYKEVVGINFVGEDAPDLAIEEMLKSDLLVSNDQGLFWSYDIGSLAQDILKVVRHLYLGGTNSQDGSNEINATQLRAVA